MEVGDIAFLFLADYVSPAEGDAFLFWFFLGLVRIDQGVVVASFCSAGVEEGARLKFKRALRAIFTSIQQA